MSRLPLQGGSCPFPEGHKGECLAVIRSIKGKVLGEIVIPDLFFKPSAKSSGRSRGSCIVSRISDLTDINPPTSSQVTLGIFGAPMASA